MKGFNWFWISDLYLPLTLIGDGFKGEEDRMVRNCNHGWIGWQPMAVVEVAVTQCLEFGLLMARL